MAISDEEKQQAEQLANLLAQQIEAQREQLENLNKESNEFAAAQAEFENLLENGKRLINDYENKSENAVTAGVGAHGKLLDTIQPQSPQPENILPAEQSPQPDPSDEVDLGYEAENTSSERDLAASLANENPEAEAAIKNSMGLEFKNGKCEVGGSTITANKDKSYSVSNPDQNEALNMGIELAMRSALHSKCDPAALDKMDRKQLAEAFHEHGCKMKIEGPENANQNILKNLESEFGIKQAKTKTPDPAKRAQRAEERKPKPEPKPEPDKPSPTQTTPSPGR